MKTTVARVCFAMLAAFACDAYGAGDENGGGAQYLQPLSEVSKVTQQFVALIHMFNDLALQAGSDQFKRDVEDLRKNLYKLEKRSEQLVYEVPDVKPVGAAKDKLVNDAAAVLNLATTINGELVQVGADLRKKDGACLEGFTDHAVSGKIHAVDNLEVALAAVDNWDAAGLRRELTSAMKDVKTAQFEATKFSNKLSATPLPAATAVPTPQMQNDCFQMG